MNLEDFATNKLANEIASALTCSVLNSEGKAQTHDYSDPYRRPGIAHGLPVMKSYRKCLRCGYVARVLRRA